MVAQKRFPVLVGNVKLRFFRKETQAACVQLLAKLFCEDVTFFGELYSPTLRRG
jgi:hypothetical protein